MELKNTKWKSLSKKHNLFFRHYATLNWIIWRKNKGLSVFFFLHITHLTKLGDCSVQLSLGNHGQPRNKLSLLPKQKPETDFVIGIHINVRSVFNVLDIRQRLSEHLKGFWQAQLFNHLFSGDAKWIIIALKFETRCVNIKSRDIPRMNKRDAVRQLHKIKPKHW